MSEPAAPDAPFWRLTAALCAAGFALLALFTAAPSLDLAVAALSGGPGGFPLERTDAVEALRSVVSTVFLAVAAAAAVGLAGRLLAPGGLAAPAGVWAFPLALAALGPGLLANVVLKGHWGRARPNDLSVFGGEADFTAAFAISGECASNCSFVSGEGSAAAAVAAVAVALFWPAGRAAQAAAAAALALWLGVAAWARMAPGAHFLSDVLFAYILTGLIAAALYRLFGIGRLRRGIGPGDLARDLGVILMRGAKALGRAAAAAARAARGLAGAPAAPRRAVPPP